MHPILFEFDVPSWLQGVLPAHLAVYSYGFFIALGIIFSYLFMVPYLKRIGLDADKVSTLYIWSIAAAFIGGKLFFYFEDPARYFLNPSQMLKNPGGGFVFYGSLLFVVPVLYWQLRQMKAPVLPFFDVLSFGGPILHSFGRIGCFMAGCCHGKVCSNALGVTFHHVKSAANPLNVPLYPTQLFDILVNIIIFITVFVVRKKQQFQGQLFLIYLMMYAVGRSVVEEFRGDETRGFIFNGWLSHSQLIAICILGVSAFLWRYLSRNHPIEIKSDTSAPSE